MTLNEVPLNQFIDHSHGNNPCGKKVLNCLIGNIIITLYVLQSWFYYYDNSKD